MRGMVGGAPWRLSEDDAEMGGEAMKMRLPFEVWLRAAVEEEVRQMVPGRMCIKRSDLQKFAYSKRCLGCRPVIADWAQQSHSEACRMRNFGELGKESPPPPHIVAKEKKIHESLAKSIEENFKKTAKGVWISGERP